MWPGLGLCVEDGKSSWSKKQKKKKGDLFACGEKKLSVLGFNLIWVCFVLAVQISCSLSFAAEKAQDSRPYHRGSQRLFDFQQYMMVKHWQEALLCTMLSYLDT